MTHVGLFLFLDLMKHLRSVTAPSSLHLTSKEVWFELWK